MESLGRDVPHDFVGVMNKRTTKVRAIGDGSLNSSCLLGLKIDDIIIAVILGKPTCLVTVFAASCQVNIIVWAQT